MSATVLAPAADPVEAPPMTYRAGGLTARRQASIHRKATLIRAWLDSQRTDPPGPGRWLVAFVETDPWPSWWRGGNLLPEDVAAAVELVAAEQYLVRRVERAGDRVRRVEVFVR